ncbi:VWA domain-containing protein [Streptomyces sp. NPDC014983]|uniref:VWA domain-containing protein n=1 Tax=Streptomyces sp. NPDC014983 TaxID=3364933 RepID=UPI0036FF0668
MTHQTTPDTTDPDLPTARAALGRRLGTVINELADRDDVLLDMVWEEAGDLPPAWFDPTTAWVTINGSVALGPGTHPDEVDPLCISGRHRHPVIMGLASHEAGHARSTRWQEWPSDAGRAIVRAAVLLEEPRIEGRQLAERPGDRVFLRASARHINLPTTIQSVPVMNRWRAATAAALVLARADAGVLTSKEVSPVRTEIARILGAADLAKLRRLWRRALKLDDGDQLGLYRISRQWVQVIGAEEDEDLPVTGCAAGALSAPGPSASEEDALTALVAAVATTVSAHAQIATGALPDPEEEARIAAEAARHEAEAQARQAAQESARQAAQRVFGAPAPSSFRRPPRNPVSGRRAPSPEERAAARRLGQALRKAQFREPARARVATALPPGRLSGRDAMLATAQRTLGHPVTARPFRATVRRHTDEPPVAVGVAVDVSGSMGTYTEIIASTAWIFAHAAREVEGTTATVAFGSAVTPIVAPGQPPAQVTQFTANDDNHRITEAVNALDGALGLSRPGGARVLVIVSDGHWEPAERRGGERLVRRLRDAGVHVIWYCLNTRSDVLPGARRVDISDIAEIPDTLGHVLVDALNTA